MTRSLTLLVLLAALAAPTLAWSEEARHPPAEAGEAAGHAAAGHEGHEGHAPVLDNWFSLSFGPGKQHQYGPLAFSILNFVALVWLLVRFGRKPLGDFLHQRHVSVRKDLDEAAQLHREARARLAEIEGKLAALDREISEIKQAVAADAELERERIIKNAEAEAERIVKQADDILAREVRNAQRRLEVEAVDAALTAAEKLIKQQLTEEDRQRLDEEYFAQIAS